MTFALTFTRLYSDHLFFEERSGEMGTGPEQFHQQVLQDLQTMQTCLQNESERRCAFLPRLRFKVQVPLLNSKN